MIESDESDFFAEDFRDITLDKKEILDKDFDDCLFENCDFSGVLFKNCRFVGCRFVHCNLSLFLPLDTKFSDISFIDCKIIGVDWTKASWESLTNRPMKFYRCILNDSSFWGLQLEGISIKECDVKEVDFSEANLIKADFSSSNFTNAIFKNTNLKDADFSNAVKFDIDIKQNELKGAKFSRFEALRLLDGLGIKLVD